MNHHPALAALLRDARAVAVLTLDLTARTAEQRSAAQTARLAFADQEAAYLRDRATAR